MYELDITAAPLTSIKNAQHIWDLQALKEFDIIEAAVQIEFQEQFSS